MYRIEISHTSSKELEKIYLFDKKLYLRIITSIEALKTNPFIGKGLKGELEGRYSLRVGSYRVIYTILEKVLVVYIIDLGPRREIYR